MANTININVNKTDLGLNLVDNTSDLNKPISNATQTALNGKEDVANKSTNTSLGTSDTLYPSQKAVKTYVDTAVSGAAVPTLAQVTAAGSGTSTPISVLNATFNSNMAFRIGGDCQIPIDDLRLAIKNNINAIANSMVPAADFYSLLNVLAGNPTPSPTPTPTPNPQGMIDADTQFAGNLNGNAAALARFDNRLNNNIIRMDPSEACNGEFTLVENSCAPVPMIIDPDNCDLCCGNAYESYFWNEFGEICPDSKCLKSNYVKNGIVYERAFFRRDGGTSTAPVKNDIAV